MADYAGTTTLATDFTWNAAGDIAYATADDTGTVLSIGSTNDVLQVTCGLPAWNTNVTLPGTLGVADTLTATGGIELSHATQNTLTGSGGCLSIEDNVVYRAGGTDVPVADGGTGRSCLTTGAILIGNGTNDITMVTQTTKGQILIGDGSGAPRMLGVGTNCQVLTACSGETTGVKWEDAGSGAVSAINNATANELVTIGSTTTELCAESALIFDGNKLFLNDSADGNLTTGLVLNQGAADDSIFTMKSSDVAQSATSAAEADTYASFKKKYADGGGLLIATYMDSDTDCSCVSKGGSFEVLATTHGVTSPTYNTANKGNVVFRAYRSDGGTSQAVMTSGDSMFSIQNGTYTRFAFGACGDGYADSAWGTYDAYCDAALLRSVDIALAPQCVIASEFDKYITYNECTLIELGILGDRVTCRETGLPLGCGEERGLWNYTKHIKLLNGAAWQQHVQLQELKSELASVKGQLNALTEGK